MRVVWIEIPSGASALNSASGTTSACGVRRPIRVCPHPSGCHMATSPSENLMRQRRVSFDHLVGAREQARRHADAERVRSLEVNGEFVLVRRLDGQTSTPSI